MVTPDFSKIWASESPLTPYTFDDDEYLEGWATIGEIPPDRRQFDTWQRLADTKMLWLKNNILGYLLRQNSTEYAVGDIAFSPSLPSSLLLECTVAGTTAATEPDFSGAVDKDTVTDGTVTWTYRKILSGDGSGGVPLAAIIPWVDDVNPVPEGFLKCDGSAVSRTAYPDLFGTIGTKYGSGDGSTTFNTPDLTDAAILNGTYDKTTFTTAGSATFVAPKDGYYKITVKGAGGGGGGGYAASGSESIGGGGGGEGGTEICYEYMTAGGTATVAIGAGGTGGVANTNGGNGGNSSVTVNANTYTGGGGVGGGAASTMNGGAGGTGTIVGAAGSSSPIRGTGITSAGGSGGGNGGGTITRTSIVTTATAGGGGAGGASGSGGHAGGDGYVWIEYVGTASQYLIKYTPTVIDSEVSAATSASQAQAAAQAAESYAGSAGIPVGTLFPYAADTVTPPTGFLFCDGSAVSRTMYPDLFAAIGTTYGPGDGSTTFNLPSEEFLKGIAFGANSTAPVYGDGTALLVQQGVLTNSCPAGSINVIESSYSVQTNYSAGGYSGINIPSKSSGISPNVYADMSDATPEYSSNIHYIIKAYDGVTPGSAGIDLSQYASDLSNKADRSLSNLNGTGEQKLTDTTESVVYEDGFAIIYPNGGSEGSPAYVAPNSRYVEVNPFDGYHVACIPEVLVSGKWEYPGQFVTNHGINASQHQDGEIIIQTGRSHLTTSDANECGSTSPFANVDSLQLRVKVWKIGKVASA